MTQVALPPELARQFLNETYRRSLYAFYQLVFEIINGYPPKPAPYLDAIAHQLERVFRGESRRLINTMPPRHGKSEMTSVAFVAWVLGHAPSTKFMLCSYGLDLSRANLSKVRQVLEDPRYQAIFPNVRIDPRERRRNAFATTAGGAVMAVSTGGAVTGFGTHILIVDDLHKADEALTPAGREAAILFYRNSLISRFNDPAHGRTIVVGQRLHDEDIVGQLLKNEADWHHINLPAIAEHDQIISLSRGQVWLRQKDDVLHPDHMPRAELEARQRESGPRIFGAQYQQSPLLGGGGLIEWPWFGQYHEMPPRDEFLKIVQAWDPAIKEEYSADYSVGMTWGFHQSGEWYLLDLFRRQIGFALLLEQVLAWTKKWRADAMIIEGASIGISLWQEVKRADVVEYPIAPPPRGSKEERLVGRSGMLATGNYRLPASAPWLHDLKRELLAFPGGSNDDQVDALSLFLEFVFSYGRVKFRGYDRRRRTARR